MRSTYRGHIGRTLHLATYSQGTSKLSMRVPNSIRPKIKPRKGSIAYVLTDLLEDAEVSKYSKNITEKPYNMKLSVGEHAGEPVLRLWRGDVVFTGGLDPRKSLIEVEQELLAHSEANRRQIIEKYGIALHAKATHQQTSREHSQMLQQ